MLNPRTTAKKITKKKQRKKLAKILKYYIIKYSLNTKESTIERTEV